MTFTALILGGEGNLARRIKSRYPDFLSYTSAECDITDENSVNGLIASKKSDYVINCAALTDVEYCEKNKDHCWQVNTVGVKNIADACLKSKSRLIHFSSDYAGNPVNEYGWSKLASEPVALSAGTVLRTNIFDTNSFIIKNLLDKKPINAFDDVYFNPISTFGLMDNLFVWNGVAKNPDAIRNVGNDDSGRRTLFIGTNKRISMYDFAICVCDVFEVDRSLVNPKHYMQYGTARRSTELYHVPSNDLDIMDDLRRFKDELEK